MNAIDGERAQGTRGAAASVIGDKAMVNVDEISEVIARRFNKAQVQTVVAQARPSKTPIIISHVISRAPTQMKTLAPPVDAAFSIHVHHRSISQGETWIDGRHADLPLIAVGAISIFDLRSSPVAAMREPFEFTRFEITQATLDDLAYARRQSCVGSLRIPELGHPDPVIYNLALALLNRAETAGEETDSLFADWIALAFHAHLVDAYSDTLPSSVARWNIPPWRLRIACEWMIDRMDGPLSIAEVAAQVDMTPGYFARAFKQATGEPPHRWLIRSRVERAKELLRTPGLTLVEIAAACGFVDQSHLTRVFRRIEGKTPGQWRQQLIQ